MGLVLGSLRTRDFGACGSRRQDVGAGEPRDSDALFLGLDACQALARQLTGTFTAFQDRQDLGQRGLAAGDHGEHAEGVFADLAAGVKIHQQHGDHAHVEAQGDAVAAVADEVAEAE